MKRITGFFTPMTPQLDVQAENPGDNNPNPLEEKTVGDDLNSRAGEPINESSSLQSETATEQSQSTDSLSTDPARWGKIDESVRAYWARKGPESVQNKDANVKASERHYKHQKRLFSKTHFKRKHLNGEYLPREWLLYSPSTGCVFCFACRLFGEGDGQSLFESGYNDWKHATRRIAEHENSDSHRKAMFNYINRAAADGVIDSQLKKQFESQCNYWSEVLQRVVAVVKFLSERGLAFRGSSEIFGRADNGNYMGILELISEFDPFLKSHIQLYGNAGVGTPSYLSSKTCDEFIELMSNRVLSEIIAEVKVTKYFSICIDSTPDMTHIDQLTFIIRYVSPEGLVEERFLKFLPISSHTGKALCDAVLTVLHEMDIDISNCRGQCYDNAANMAGVYNGLQAHIKDINPLVEWVPCAAHTLNLAGVNSVNCCTETADFFNFIQTLFNFCSKSTARWKVVTAGLQPNENHRIETLKSLSDTRWAAHAQATKALCRNYANIQESLMNIAEDSKQNPTTQNDAWSLHKKMNRLETAFLCTMWNYVLQRFHGTSVALQAVDLDLCNAVDLVRSLREYIVGLRDEFDVFEDQAKAMSPTVSETYKQDTQRQRKRKTHVGESATPEVHLSGRERFSSGVFLVVMDRLLAELDRRFQSYNDLNSTFGFLNNISTLSAEHLHKKAADLQKRYHTDLENEFCEEIIQFKEFICHDEPSSARELLLCIKKRKLQTIFPNVDVALRLYLTLPVTNASGERSFSKLKLVKNRLRSTIVQQKLNNLTLMSIESDLLRKVDFTDLIKDFAAKKSRRCHF